MTLVGAGIGLGLVVLGTFKSQNDLVQYGLMLLGGNTIGYTVGRSAVKFAHGWGSGDPAPTPSPAAPKP